MNESDLFLKLLLLNLVFGCKEEKNKKKPCCKFESLKFNCEIVVPAGYIKSGKPSASPGVNCLRCDPKEICKYAKKIQK